MEFRILGPLAVLRGGQAVDLGRAQQRLLLARLLVEAGHPVSVDRLVDDLWGDAPPLGAAESLQALVSRLRRALEPDRRPRDPAAVLVTRAPGYAVEVGPGLDADRFTQEAAAGAAALAAGDAAESSRLLTTALGRWRGEVLADLADAAFVAPVAVRLHDLRAAAREDLAAAWSALGTPVPAIAELEALTSEDPWRERAWERLATALHRAGRTAEALARLREVRGRFADELGLDVGTGLRAVEAALLDGRDPDGVLPAPPVQHVPVAAPPAAEPVAPPLVDEPVVGRLREVALLDEAVDHVAAGVPRWVALVGEPGIGKTRLAEHAVARAQARGFHVAWGRAHEDRAMPALWPWVQVLRDLGIADAGALLGASRGGDLAADRFDRCDRLLRTLVEVAAGRPVLVVLDDLHWGDAESLGLLDLLAGEVRDVRLGVLVTTRSTESTPAVDRVVSDLTRRSGGSRVDLVGLDHDATGSLAAAIEGRELTPDEVGRLHERTGGNPYFVSEYSRLGGAVVPLDQVPDGVRDVLRRRLAPLEDHTRDVLALAAVAGLEFDADLVASATGSTRAEVGTALAGAVDARIVRTSTDTPGRYQFAHALVRAVLREDLADLDRRRHHLALAEALAPRAAADPDRWLPEQAGHLVGAAPLSDAATTVEACEAAARLAARRLAHDEAVVWHTRALQAFDGDSRSAHDRARRAVLLTELGISHGDAGDHPRALVTLADAVDAAEAIGDTAAMARAVQAFDRAGGFWFWVEQYTRPTHLLDRIDRTLAALGDADSPERVRVLVVRAVGEYYGDHELGLGLAREAHAVADRLGDPLILADSLVGMLNIGWRPTRMVEQRHLADELLTLARSLGARHQEQVALIHQYVGALSRGDVADAQRWHDAALTLARERRQVLVVVQLMWSRAMFAALRGDFVAAHAAAAEAEALHRRTGLYALDRAVGQTVGTFCWEQGTFGALPDDRRARVLDGFPETRVADAHRRGELVTARRLLADLVARPLPPSYESVGLRLAQARLACDLGDRDAVTVLRPLLRPHADDFGGMGTVGCTGPVRLQLARMASLLGEHDDALADLERVGDATHRDRLPVWNLRAREALAVALARRDRPGDRDRAAELTATLAEDASHLGVALDDHVVGAVQLA